MTELAIETQGLTKRFGSKIAVNSLDLAIPVGSVYGFLGRNGAGKTTTIKMLLGLISPSSGSAKVLGLHPKKEGLALKRQVGYVAENQSMYEWMKVKEIIKFTAGFYPEWDFSLASDFCTRFELDPSAKLKTLSRGQLMRLALTLALAPHPRLLILDDPTMGLDPITRKEFLNDIVIALHEEGRTIFFSTHILSELELVADHIAIIDKGKLKISEPIDSLKSTVKIIRLTFDNGPPPDIEIEGLLRIQKDGRDCSVTINGFTDDTLARIRRQLRPVSMEVHNPSLEEIFTEFVLAG